MVLYLAAFLYFLYCLTSFSTYNLRGEKNLKMLFVYTLSHCSTRNLHEWTARSVLRSTELIIILESTAALLSATSKGNSLQWAMCSLHHKPLAVKVALSHCTACVDLELSIQNDNDVPKNRSKGVVMNSSEGIM